MLFAFLKVFEVNFKQSNKRCFVIQGIILERMYIREGNIQVPFNI